MKTNKMYKTTILTWLQENAPLIYAVGLSVIIAYGRLTHDGVGGRRRWVTSNLTVEMKTHITLCSRVLLATAKVIKSRTLFLKALKGITIRTYFNGTLIGEYQAVDEWDGL